MAAPTFVSATPTATFDGTQGKSTASISAQTGDLLVALCGNENYDSTQNTTTSANTLTVSGGGLTWTLQQNFVPGTNSTNTYVVIFTATATSTTSFAVSMFRNGNGSGTAEFGGAVQVWRNHGGVGTGKGATSGSGGPSLTFSTSAANSGIAIVNGDYAAVTGTATWRSVNGSAATSDASYQNASTYGLYVGHHTDAGAAGSKTVGLTAPTGQTFSIAAIEILAAGGSSQSQAPRSMHQFRQRFAS
jgi:hypothetical protein